jgi:hypothetical protein
VEEEEEEEGGNEWFGDMEGNMTRGRRNGGIGCGYVKWTANNGQRGWPFEKEGIWCPVQKIFHVFFGVFPLGDGKLFVGLIKKSDELTRLLLLII